MIIIKQINYNKNLKEFIFQKIR